MVCMLEHTAVCGSTNSEYTAVCGIAVTSMRQYAELQARTMRQYADRVMTHTRRPAVFAVCIPKEWINIVND